MDTEWATESVRIKRVELCSSPPPPTHTHTHTHAEGNGNSEGRRGVQKDAISDGVVGEVASRGFFPCLQVRLHGELSKTNNRTAEQALSHFTVDDLLKQELLFSSTIFY